MPLDENKNHTLCLEEQKRLSVSGVLSVDGFSEENITASLKDSRLYINGSGLKIAAFSKNTGMLNVEGIIYTIKYTKPKVSIIKRLTK